MRPPGTCGTALLALLLAGACGPPWEPTWEGTYVGSQEAVDAQGVGERRPGRVVVQRASWGTPRRGTLLRGLADLDGCVVALRAAGNVLVQEGSSTCQRRERRTTGGVETVVEFRWRVEQARVSRLEEDGDEDGSVRVEARLDAQQVQVTDDGTETTVASSVSRVTFEGARVAD